MSDATALKLLNDPNGIRYLNTSAYVTEARLKMYKAAPYHFLSASGISEVNMPAHLNMAASCYAAAMSLMEDSDDPNNLSQAKAFMNIFEGSI